MGTPTEQAAAWFARLRADDVTGADRAEFERWLQCDFEHCAAYESFERLWSETGAYAGEPAVAQSIKRFSSVRRVTAWLIGAAAMAALLSFATVGYQWQRNHGAHETTIGERQTISLPDGSQLTLNTDTAIRVDFSSTQRRIYLKQGQAYFKVVQEARRPFEVVSRRGVVRALGTEFEVYQQEDQLLVTLLEGKIAVSESLDVNGGLIETKILGPGERLALRSGAKPMIRIVSAKRSTAWLAGRLVFDDEPLPSALAEANRYSTRKITLASDSLKTLRIGGVYQAGKPEQFVQAISAYFPVRALRAENGDYLLVTR